MGRIIKKQSLVRKLEKFQLAQKNAGSASQGISNEQIKKLNEDPIRIEVQKKQKRVFSQKHRKLAKRGAAVSRGAQWQKPTKSPTWTIYPTASWFSSQGPIDVSIVVPMYKSKSAIIEQINSWDLFPDSLTKEIIYVSDACPQKSYLGVLQAWEGQKRNLKGKKVGKIIIHNENGGFGTACNTGAKNASGKYLLFLNADCTVTSNWVEPLIARMKSDPTIGIVGNLQLKNNDIIDSAGSYWTGASFEHIGKTVYQGKRTRPMRWQSAPSDLRAAGERQMVTGCCFLMPRHLFFRVGGFDPEYLIGYWEDADLNMKVRAIGYKVFFEPKSKIYHAGQHSHSGGHRFQGVNRAKFKKDWVDSGVLKLLNDDMGKPKLDISKEKVVVYTAIINNYDNLSEGQNKKGTDFVAFLDNIKTKSSKIWKILPASKSLEDPNRNAKIHKILSHKYFPDYDYSLWIDGNVNLKIPVRELINTFLRNADMAVFKHPERHCIYDEARACISRRLDKTFVIENQINQYRKQGYPVRGGLAECTIILRRHTHIVKKFNELWWKEIENGSKRDQISFPVIAKKVGIKYNYFPGSLRDSYNLIFKKQGSHKRGH